LFQNRCYLLPLVIRSAAFAVEDHHPDGRGSLREKAGTDCRQDYLDQDKAIPAAMVN
jgi:hypothetical protein